MQKLEQGSCPVCGMQKIDRSRYCPQCGHLLEMSFDSAYSLLQDQSGICKACEPTGCTCRQNPYFKRIKGKG